MKLAYIAAVGHLYLSNDSCIYCPYPLNKQLNVKFAVYEKVKLFR